MAKCLSQLGRADEAFDTRKRILELRIRVNGRAHADTLWAMNSLGLCYEGRGEMGEAGRWHMEAWGGQRRLFGEGHAHVRWSEGALRRTGVLA